MQNNVNSSNTYRANVGNYLPKENKKDEKIAENNKPNKAEQPQPQQNVSPEHAIEFMNAQGNLNKVLVNTSTTYTPVENINPKDYLSADRIQDIERFMEHYEDAFNESYAAFEAELGDSASPAAKQNLAMMYISNYF